MRAARVGTGALARPVCVGTAAPGRPSRAKLGSCQRSQQLRVRDKRSMIRSVIP